MSRPPSRDGPGHRRRVDRSPGIRFSGPEVRDLLAAWVALSVAFAILFAGGGQGLTAAVAAGEWGGIGRLLGVSFLTAGLGFMLHELAHKVVAVRFGQVAEFRAEYGMLAIAVMLSLAGFIFAAPGAVHHRGRISDREHGLIALAGPVTNLLLAAVFLGVLVVGLGVDAIPWELGVYGLVINLLLAGFNMLPFGPLDGRTVLSWSAVVYVLVAAPSILLGLAALFLL